MIRLNASVVPGAPSTLLCFALTVCGCSQRPLDELLDSQSADLNRNLDRLPASSDATESVFDPGEYFPLARDLTWTWLRTSADGDTRVETIRMTDLADSNAPAYQVTSQQDDPGDRDVETWLQLGTRVERTQELKVENGVVAQQTDYEPGFTRFDFAWNRLGATTTSNYRRTVIEAAGTTTESERSHRYVVTSVDEQVDLAMGSFYPCLVVERTRGDSRTIMWFAAGIGKVQERDMVNGEEKELLSFD